MPGIERYRRLGLCISCGGEREPKKTRCRPCLDRSNERCRNRHKALRARGMCIDCGSAKAIVGKVHCQECAESRKTERESLKRLIFDQYGGPVCACCGETTWEFLTIDHIENARHHAAKKAGIWDTQGSPLYRKLRRLDFPSGYQVLCMNCNVGKRIAGICPHKRTRTEAPTPPSLKEDNKDA